MRALRLWLWPAGAAVGIVAEWVFFGWNDPDEWLPDLATGWTLIACGLVGWARRPESRSGPLLAATGFAWFAANLLGDQALYLHRGPLIQLTLTYPYGRLGSRLDRVAVAVAYGAALVPAVWSSDIATFALCALFVLAAGRGYAGAVGRERRARRAAFGATAFVGAVLVGSAAARLAVPTARAHGRDAAGLRGRAVRVSRRAAGGPRRAAVDAYEGHRPRRRSRPDGFRHAARRARQGAWRSHARGRLLAR